MKKTFECPEFDVGAPDRPMQVQMDYGVDTWIIGDCALLLLPPWLPGLVALGVDFGTGAWRDLENPQHVVVPAPGK